MGKVKLLPPDLISKIAAGEVIERPASVVKELIENSLDAGSSRIDIRIANAGKTLIRIADNGAGIDNDDLEKLFNRHATSKLHSTDELFSIGTLGFRGEALYSIAAVSDVLLRSRTGESDMGWEIHVRGGDRVGLKPVSMQRGTAIEVKELFFNTPARRKFMKTDSTELTQILNVVIPYALLDHGTQFTLSHHDKKLIDLSPAEDRLARVARALRVDARSIIEAYRSSDDKDMSVRLFLGDINIQRPRKDMQHIFINGRPVHNHIISFHLNQIYRLILPQGVHPFFSVFVDLPPDSIDVNIHPAKREVRIKDERYLVQMLRPLCENALMNKGRPKKVKESWGPSLRHCEEPVDKPMATKQSQDSPVIASEAKQSHIKQYTLFRDAAHDAASPERREDTFRGKLASSRHIGSFMRKYLLFESGASLLLIDQHAAHERIAYEAYLRQLGSGHIEIQHLLTPFVLRLSSQEMLAWEEMKDKLESIGLPTTQWDNESIAIHSHPQLIAKPETSVRTILAGDKPHRWDDETLARWACRSSVMAGDEVSKEGAMYLLKQLLACNDPFTCPHGRPTVLEVDEKFLSKQFMRT